MTLESEFNESMLNIYRRAKSEAKYNAIIFLQMVTDHGGLEAAKRLINATNISDGYTALWERGKLELTVEATVLENEKYHPLFTAEELAICRKRLTDYHYFK